MNLKKKKSLATRTLKVGKERIVFLKSRLDEIKEAITKQDIKDLKKRGSNNCKRNKRKKKSRKEKKKKKFWKYKKKSK